MSLSTHSNDVILPEAQFIVIVSLKVQQSLRPSPSVARHHKKVFMISLVALHGVVRSQVLQRQGGRGLLRMNGGFYTECYDIMVSQYYI